MSVYVAPVKKIPALMRASLCAVRWWDFRQDDQEGVLHPPRHSHFTISRLLLAIVVVLMIGVPQCMQYLNSSSSCDSSTIQRLVLSHWWSSSSQSVSLDVREVLDGWKSSSQSSAATETSGLVSLLSFGGCRKLMVH